MRIIGKKDDLFTVLMMVGTSTEIARMMNVDEELSLKSKRFKCRKTLDNMYKAVTDAMTGIVYADDAQIVEAKISKGYAGRLPEGAYVTVEEAEQ